MIKRINGLAGGRPLKGLIACGKVILSTEGGIEVIDAPDVQVGDIVILTLVSDDSNVGITQLLGVAGKGYLTVTRNNAGYLANDTTLAFGFVDTDSTGVTFGASTNTTAGVAGSGFTLGTAQVETITCTAGESTGAGDITMTITSANMSNSPKAVVVPVALADGVNDVGLALRTALLADPDVSAYFDVSGADASAILTAKVASGNDAEVQIFVARPE